MQSDSALALPVDEYSMESEQAPFLERLLHNRLGMVGAVIILGFVLTAVFADQLAPHDPNLIDAPNKLAPPGNGHPLGTDELGRDLLSRAIYGARVSLQVGIASVAAACLFGVFFGIVAGYRRGAFDTVSMRVMDVIFAFPTILLALVLAAALGPDVRNLMFAIAIVYTPAFARIARGATMSVTAQPFVEAALAIGARTPRILRRYILPNIAAPVAVQITVSFAYAVLLEASLSFLGLGIQPPTPSWGAMLSSGRTYLEVSMWPSLVPGVAIMLAVLGFNLLGDGLRDALDPRLQD
jgi:peptide/nickel transport system permease protein